MSIMAVSDREFGELSQEVKHLTESLREVRLEVRTIDHKVDGIITRFDRIDGGMKVAMAVSGFLGAAAMLVMTKLLPLLFAGFTRL